jgi:hypothetical protein
LIGGVVDRTIAERGTIWLASPGSKEVLVDIAASVPQMLHMCLPPTLSEVELERPALSAAGVRLVSRSI